MGGDAEVLIEAEEPTRAGARRAGRARSLGQSPSPAPSAAASCSRPAAPQSWRCRSRRAGRHVKRLGDRVAEGGALEDVELEGGEALLELAERGDGHRTAWPTCMFATTRWYASIASGRWEARAIASSMAMRRPRTSPRASKARRIVTARKVAAKSRCLTSYSDASWCTRLIVSEFARPTNWCTASSSGSAAAATCSARAGSEVPASVGGSPSSSRAGIRC